MSILETENNQPHKITHAELVKVAENWLYKTIGCGVVFSEFVTQAMEIPDALGLKASYSYLVECKISRSDFAADKKKFFRRFPEEGVGDFRFYLCPKDLIKLEELPDKWGLLYFDGKRVKKIKSPRGNISSQWLDFRFEKSRLQEFRIMYSALRRIKLRGHLDAIYEKLEN